MKTYYIAKWIQIADYSGDRTIVISDTIEILSKSYSCIEVAVATEVTDPWQDGSTDVVEGKMFLCTGGTTRPIPNRDDVESSTRYYISETLSTILEYMASCSRSEE